MKNVTEVGKTEISSQTVDKEREKRHGKQCLLQQCTTLPTYTSLQETAHHGAFLALGKKSELQTKGELFMLTPSPIALLQYGNVTFLFCSTTSSRTHLHIVSRPSGRALVARQHTSTSLSPSFALLTALTTSCHRPVILQNASILKC